MQILRAATLALAAILAACGATSQPTRLWETPGFQQPESALADTASGAIYVSNVAGGPTDRDGNGFISKLTLDGKLTNEKWVTGLDAPKGLALYEGKLYVADLDHLIEIDVATGTIANRHLAEGAKILNGIAADGEGNIYVSDWGGNAIWRFGDGILEKWVEGDALKHPNGLLLDGDNLVVAAWGSGMKEDFSVETAGNLLTVNLTDKSVANLGSGAPIGNLDGIVSYDTDSYLVSDWVAGKIFRIKRTGEAEDFLALSQGTADINLVPGTRTLLIPLMVDGKVAAYTY